MFILQPFQGLLFFNQAIKIKFNCIENFVVCHAAGHEIKLAHVFSSAAVQNKIQPFFLTLAVPRNYKNSNGEYDTDFLDCTLWSAVAESTSEYCETGDMIGIKGRLQTRVVETPEGTKRKKTEIIAEKVTFLTSNPQRRKSESSVEELSEDQEEKVEE